MNLFIEQKDCVRKPRVISVENFSQKYTIIKPNQIREKNASVFKFVTRGYKTIGSSSIVKDSLLNKNVTVWKANDRIVSNHPSCSKKLQLNGKNQVEVLEWPGLRSKSYTPEEFFSCPKYASLSRHSCEVTKEKHQVKLDKPEYNSIKHTIKKMKEIEGEPIAKNVDSLPSYIKQYIVKKVSKTVNYLPKERIYQDLVDLTIDEKDLLQPKTRKIRKYSSRDTSAYTSARSMQGVPSLHFGTSSETMSSKYY